MRWQRFLIQTRKINIEKKVIYYLFSPTDAIGEDDAELEIVADKAALLLPERIPTRLQQANDGNEVSN